MTWDRRDALDRAAGDEDLLQELLDMFCQDLNEKIQDLKSLLRSRDQMALSRVAHSLKGSSSSVSAYDITEVCRIMESKAASPVPDWAQLENLVFDLEKEMGIFKKEAGCKA